MKQYILTTIIASLYTIILFPIRGIASDTIPNDSIYIIAEIKIAGNKKTQAPVVYRELMFAVGDTIKAGNLDEVFQKSRDNLNNTSLFNYITITSVTQNSIYKTVYIILEERWYLWPNVIFEQADRNLSSFIHERDWSRINYGFMLKKFNFRGRRETLRFKFRKGYKEQFQIFYENPFLFNSKVNGFSAEFSWFRQNETAVNIINDQQTYYKEDNNYVLNYYTTGITYKNRKQYYINHRLSLYFTYGRVNDSVLYYSPEYFGNNQNTTRYFELNYYFDIDKRNYRYYPLKGYYFEVQLRQIGLNLLKNEMQPISEISSKYTYFANLQHRFYGGVGTRVKVSSNRKQPFFIEQALGFDDYLRAYEYYVISGQHFFTARSFIKYEVLPTHITKLRFFNWDKFNKIHYSIYANLFYDSGYVWDIRPRPGNVLSNKYLMSVGAGIDLVAYYDQIIRFEYSINRKKEHGFFLHVGKAF